MKVSEVWVSAGLTINTGDYESARCEAGAKVCLEDNDKQIDAYKFGWQIVSVQIAEQVEGINSKVAQKVRDRK